MSKMLFVLNLFGFGCGDNHLKLKDCISESSELQSSHSSRRRLAEGSYFHLNGSRAKLCVYLKTDLRKHKSLKLLKDH